MWMLAALAHVLLAVLALRGARWAYVAFVALGLAYFPTRVSFAVEPRACQLAFGAELAIASVGNYAHTVLFGLFFVMSAVHFGGRRWAGRPALARAAVATLALGALVELAQGLTGNGNCRLRDLIPDSVGALLGAAVLTLTARALAMIADTVPGRRRATK
jgi:hypothetical protein